MTVLAPSLLSILRARAEALHKAADRLVKINGQLLYGVHLHTVRAYVWASHRGKDPAAAVRRTIYGGGDLGQGGLDHIAAIVTHLNACAMSPSVRRAA
ncbi:MAG: hypothetical protein GC145_14500 [Caulobacter sp.]|nr:hypothetical protein [Caulobacter sp.]